jgi:hypothetical protein
MRKVSGRAEEKERGRWNGQKVNPFPVRMLSMSARSGDYNQLTLNRKSAAFAPAKYVGLPANFACPAQFFQLPSGNRNKCAL